MAVGLLGTLDLSVVTDRLLTMLHTYYDNWPRWDLNGGPVPKFNTTFSGAMPESVRGKGGCQLTLYLMHVREDATQRNSPVMGRTLTVPFQPLSLDLYYLLTAFSADDYHQEQRAMSIAMRCLYENPIVTATVPTDSTNNVEEEFVVQMQPESSDELGRVWQAFGTPLRLSCVYRAGVVFVTPKASEAQPASPAKRVVVAPEPATLPFAKQGQVVGTRSTVRALAPSSTPASPQVRTYELAPAVVAAGDAFLLLGAGLGGPTSSRVYLLAADGTEQEVTAWADPAASAASRLALKVPSGAAPPAGVYQLRVGSDTAAGDPLTYRSNATAFSVAAKVGPATNPPLLTPSAGVYTVAGAGFIAGATDVLLGTAALGATSSGTLGPGEFQVDGPTSIRFRPAAGVPAGVYGVRVRTAGVESAPAWWVTLP